MWRRITLSTQSRQSGLLILFRAGIHSLVDRTWRLLYNSLMKKYNLFTWMIDFSGKPLSYKVWVAVVFPVLFLIWLCMQFVFKEFLAGYFLYAALPCTVIGLVWDLAIFFYYRHIGAFNEDMTLKEGYPRRFRFKRKERNGRAD